MSAAQFPKELRKPQLEAASDIEGMRGYMFQGPDGSQVVLWECDIDLEVGPHKHDFDEYCLVVEGTCEETIEGKTTVLRKGDEIVILSGRMHWAKIKAGYRAIDFFGGERLRYRKAPRS
jgi:quercetin dioxygenase-like cupin family protein